MAGECSLSDVLERMYQNQLALEAALMALTLHVEAQGSAERPRCFVGHWRERWAHKARFCEAQKSVLSRALPEEAKKRRQEGSKQVVPTLIHRRFAAMDAS